MLALTFSGGPLGTYVRPGSLGPGAYQTPKPSMPSYYGSGGTTTPSAGPMFTTNQGPIRNPVGPLGPLPPQTPSTPGTGPVIINTTPIPGVPLEPPQQVPGAGPVLTTSPAPGGGAWYDLFDPQSFTWWKPVLLAGGIALFGGAILVLFKRKR